MSTVQYGAQLEFEYGCSGSLSMVAVQFEYSCNYSVNMVAVAVEHAYS